MKVLVDTCIWSLALRRRVGDLSAAEVTLVESLAALIRARRVLMLGVIRQEVLSGIRSAIEFEALRARLAAFRDHPLQTLDFEEAARACNTCLARGIAGSSVDFLICAVALRCDVEVFTTDADFRRFAKALPLRLHLPNTAKSS